VVVRAAVLEARLFDLLGELQDGAPPKDAYGGAARIVEMCRERLDCIPAEHQHQYLECLCDVQATLRRRNDLVHSVWVRGGSTGWRSHRSAPESHGKIRWVEGITPATINADADHIEGLVDDVLGTWLPKAQIWRQRLPRPDGPAGHAGTGECSAAEPAEQAPDDSNRDSNGERSRAVRASPRPADGVPTACGGSRWYPSTIAAVLRSQAASAMCA